jgi:hypothetical protein
VHCDLLLRMYPQAEGLTNAAIFRRRLCCACRCDLDMRHSKFSSYRFSLKLREIPFRRELIGMEENTAHIYCLEIVQSRQFETNSENG